RQGVSPVNGRSGGAGKITGNPPPALDDAGHDSLNPPFGAGDTPGFVGTDPVNFRGGTIDRDIDQAPWRRVVRVPSGIAFFVHERLEVMAVAGNELSPAVVKTHAVLPAASFGPDLQRC